MGVFSPSHRNHYLNVTPTNLLRIYSPEPDVGLSQPEVSWGVGERGRTDPPFPIRGPPAAHLSQVSLSQERSAPIPHRIPARGDGDPLRTGSCDAQQPPRGSALRPQSRRPTQEESAGSDGCTAADLGEERSSAPHGERRLPKPLSRGPTPTPSLPLPLQTTWMGSCGTSPRISSQPRPRMSRAELCALPALCWERSVLLCLHPIPLRLRWVRCGAEEPCSPHPPPDPPLKGCWFRSPLAPPLHSTLSPQNPPRGVPPPHPQNRSPLQALTPQPPPPTLHPPAGYAPSPPPLPT